MAKIELSAHTSAEIEIAVEDDARNSVEGIVSITRSEFEALIKDDIDRTAEMLKKILTRNSLRPQDLQFVLNGRLICLLPEQEKKSNDLRYFTGIS